MIFVDVEASGVVYSRHSIVSIGALDFDNIKNRFYVECRLWDGAEINDESLAITGFSPEEVKSESRVTEGEAVRMFLEWSQHMGDRTLAGQNVSFDRDYLKAASDREGLSWDMAYRTLDTHSFAWMHMIKRGMKPPIDSEHRRSSLNLEEIAKYVGIPEEPQPHNALTGALVHAEVTSRLLNDKKLLPEFEKFDIPWL